MLHQHHPLAGKEIGLEGAGALTVRAAADCARFSLRIEPTDATAAAKTFGAALPDVIGAVSQAGERLAAKLGPDEWYLLAPSDEGKAIADAFAALGAKHPHSLVDISHREIGIEVEGAQAALALSSALAFEVEAMSAGTACRTIFDRAQIVLIRHSADRFRIEVWPSFAAHVWGILQAASREIALGI